MSEPECKYDIKSIWCSWSHLIQLSLFLPQSVWIDPLSRDFRNEERSLKHKNTILRNHNILI